MSFSVSSGVQRKPYKVVIYGPEGIGKTLLAKDFPEPLFIDTENSTRSYNVRRIQNPNGDSRPSSWAMLMEMVAAVRDGCFPDVQTLVIDTADWAEVLCLQDVCSKHKKDGIEDFGYGKGYTYAEEEWGKLLNRLEEVVERGIHVVITAHAQLRKVELPEETGSYDHWEMKLEKKNAAITKECADIVLFCNYKTLVTKGANPMEKNKASGGTRMMHAVHTPWWDAKNRHGLPEDMPLLFASIAHLFRTAPAAEKPLPFDAEDPAPLSEPQPASAAPVRDTPESVTGIPRALADLMTADGVTEAELQAVVAARGYYPPDTPIAKYDPQFVAGCLVACWNSVKAQIKH